MSEHIFNPTLSVGDAKRQLLYDKPQLSIEEAKLQLYGEAPPSLSVSEAKRQLMGGSPTQLSVGDAKRQLLAQATQVKKEAITPEALPLPVEPIAPVAQVPESEALLTDQQADSFGGGIANLALGVFGGAAQVVGDAITFVPQMGNLLQSINLSEDDYYIVNEIQGKQAAGIELSEGEQAYFDAEKSGKIARVNDIKAKSEFISAIKIGVDSVQSWQNQAKQQVAIQGIQADAAKAAEEFSNGDYLSGFGTFIGGMATLAVDNPAAALELTVSSLPQMLALQFKALPAITSLSVANTGEAIKGFEEEYGRKPDDSETAIALALSTISASADAFGAKLALGGNKLLGSVVYLAKSTGLSISKVSLNKARKALAESAAKGAVTTVKATGGEALTEGTQNVLDQLAAKQDPSKVSIEGALTDAIIGGVAGGFLTGPNVIGGISAVTAGTIRETVSKAATTIVDKAKPVAAKVAVGKRDDIIASAKENNKPEAGIAEIRKINFQELDEDTQLDYLDEFETFIDQYATDVNVDTEKLVAYEQELNDLTDAVNDSNQPVSDAVETLSDEDSTPAVVKEATEHLANHVRTSATITPAEVDRTLGSDSSFRDNASEADIKVVEDLQTYQKAIKVAKDINNVEDDVLQGSEDSGFAGTESIMRQAKYAINKGDTKGVTAATIILKDYLAVQQAKLADTTDTIISAGLDNEIDVLQATIQQINTLSQGGNKIAAVKARYAERARKAKEFKVAEPKPKAKPEVEAKAESVKGPLLDEVNETQYNTLKDITITREEGEEAVTFNAAQEYETLTKRMSGLETIWKECK